MIPNRDLLFLYSTIRRVPVNLAYCLATYFAASSRTKSSPVCAGGFVTRLARSFEVFSRGVVSRLRHLHDPILLDTQALSAMKRVSFTPDVWRLLNNEGGIWDPDEAQESPPASPAGSSPEQERPPSPNPEPTFGRFPGGPSGSGYQNLGYQNPLLQSFSPPYDGYSDRFDRLDSAMKRFQLSSDRSWEALQRVQEEQQQRVEKQLRVRSNDDNESC